MYANNQQGNGLYENVCQIIKDYQVLNFIIIVNNNLADTKFAKEYAIFNKDIKGTINSN